MDNDDHFDLIYGEIFKASAKSKAKAAPKVVPDGPKKGEHSKSLAQKRGHSDSQPSLLKKRNFKEATQELTPSHQPDVQIKGLNEKTKHDLKVFRKVGEKEWIDESLADWPENDFRIYCCNLGNEVSDDVLAGAFKKYTSFLKSKVIRDKKTTKSLGYGFVSLGDCNDYVRAMRELNGKYVGNRPIKMLPSKWTEKSLNKGFGVIKQGNSANLLAQKESWTETAKPQQITSFGGQDASSVSLARKYAHLIGEQNVDKIEKLLEKKRRN